FGLELLLGANRAKYSAPHLFGCFHLTCDLVGPAMGNMAVGADGTHTGAVGIMHCRLQLLEGSSIHLMARDTELLSVGGHHGSIETTPEDHPSNKAAQG